MKENCSKKQNKLLFIKIFNLVLLFAMLMRDRCVQ